MRLFSFVAVMLAASLLSAAEPPKIKSSGPVPPGGFADLTIDVPKSASVVWRISPNPVQKAATLPTGRIIFGGEQNKTYTVTAIVIDFDAKTVTDTDYSITFGKAPPVVVDPPKKDPPATPTSGLYFLIVRPDGPATSQFTKTMGESAWGQLRKAGHLVKDFGVSEASKWVPAPDTLPAVYTLQEANGASKIVRGAVPLPTTSAAILDLPKGVK